MTENVTQNGSGTALARRRSGRGMYPKGARMQRFSEGHSLPEYLEPAEVNGLIRFAPNPQAALLFLVCWRSGLRISEALSIRTADITHETLRVRRGKGGKDRLVPVHPELGAAFRSALAFGAKRELLFDITRHTAWRWVKEAQERAVNAGVLMNGKRIGTHTLRHSFARHALASGVPINVLSRWLGHASLQTTLIYLQILPDPLGHIERVP